jgi:hypothetical protein
MDPLPSELINEILSNLNFSSAFTLRLLSIRYNNIVLQYNWYNSGFKLKSINKLEFIKQNFNVNYIDLSSSDIKDDDLTKLSAFHIVNIQNWKNITLREIYQNINYVNTIPMTEKITHDLIAQTKLQGSQLYYYPKYYNADISETITECKRKVVKIIEDISPTTTTQIVLKTTYLRDDIIKSMTYLLEKKQYTVFNFIGFDSL